LSWKDAHEAWERKTNRSLSPAAFGKRIFALKGPRAVKERRMRTTHHTEPDQHHVLGQTALPRTEMAVAAVDLHRPKSSGPNFQPVNGSMTAHHALLTPQFHAQIAPPFDTLESQRRDLLLVDMAVGRLQQEMLDLRKAMEHLTQELRSRPTPVKRNEDDSATLEMLSETVASVSSRAGEVDGLKVQMEVLKRRVKKLEDASPPPPPPPEPQQNPFPRQSFPQQQFNSPIPPSQSIAPSSQTLDHDRQNSHAGSQWNAVNNSLKRKADGELLDGQHSKQARISQFDNSLNPLPTRPRMTEEFGDVSQPQSPSAHRPNSSRGTLPIHIADSQDSWRPESQQLSQAPAVRGQDTTKRGPGRPRKSTPLDLGTPDWEKSNWNSSQQVDSDGYYRPLGGIPPTSPTMSDRGRIIRRGSGGGLMEGAAGVTRLEHSKKTRQKPLRNADGVLIRKDGRPDQRSISSPMNLKKVHTKRQLELEVLNNALRGGLDSPTAAETSPQPAPAGGLTSTPDLVAGGETATAIKQIPGVPDLHTNVMHKMFPNGVHDDQEKMNHAAHFFAPTSSQEVKMQPRADMIREEISATNTPSKPRTIAIADMRRDADSITVEDSPELQDPQAPRADMTRQEVVVVPTTPSKSKTMNMAEIRKVADHVYRSSHEPEPEPEREEMHEQEQEQEVEQEQEQQEQEQEQSEDSDPSFVPSTMATSKDETQPSALV